MEQTIRAFKIAISSLLVIIAALLALFYPVFGFAQIPPYRGLRIENLNLPRYDETKKTVFIVADGVSTEMFDMLAPFYMFNATGQLNVLIVAKDATPIPMKRDLYVLPQMTFAEVESRRLKADVIVIPALAARDGNQDAAIIGFIKGHFTDDTRIISICDGATTAAATGLYDGKPITAHASDLNCVRRNFKKPVWTQNVTVTKSGRLYSTAGVSNAVEGALVIVEDILGKDARIAVSKSVNYLHDEIQLAHNSQALTFGNKLSVLRKMVFNRRRIGLLLHEGFNELKFAGILDTYSRTYPKEFKTFALTGSVFRSQNGLTFIHTGNNVINAKMNDVYVVAPEKLTESDRQYFEGFELVNQNGREYPIDQCIRRIQSQYGTHYAQIVKLTLDYN